MNFSWLEACRQVLCDCLYFSPAFGQHELGATGHHKFWTFLQTLILCGCAHWTWSWVACRWWFILMRKAKRHSDFTMRQLRKLDWNYKVGDFRCKLCYFNVLFKCAVLSVYTHRVTWPPVLEVKVCPFLSCSGERKLGSACVICEVMPLPHPYCPFLISKVWTRVI